MGKSKDMIGKRFGKWLVVEFSHKGIPPNNHSYWHTVCDCGTASVVCGSDLRRGRSVQCTVCAHIALGENNSTHGATKGNKINSLYKAWRAMKGRVNSNDPSYYPYYKAKGITVCEEWRQSFETFRDWSLSHNWEKGLTLDREDFNGNYCPENCRWVSRKVQQRNRSNCLFIEVSPGLTLSFQDAIDYFGNVVNFPAAKIRIAKHDWDPLRAVSTPTIRGRPKPTP